MCWGVYCCVHSAVGCVNFTLNKHTEIPEMEVYECMVEVFPLVVEQVSGYIAEHGIDDGDDLFGIIVHKCLFDFKYRINRFGRWAPEQRPDEVAGHGCRQLGDGHAHNRGKLVEYQHMFGNLPLELVTLNDVGIHKDVEETGTTFAENARLKATTYAQQSGLLTLADDSGLEVDALGGEPGVYSKRYAGEGKSDAERVVFLLDKLRDVPQGKRSARFRCAIAIASPDGKLHETDGTCEGEIIFAPRGSNGFGYDPIFFFPPRDMTMAQLSPEEKNRVSHRAQASVHAKTILEKMI